jgi:hypothetical protein
LIPFFRTQSDVISTADRVAADYAEPLVVTTQTNGTGLINGLYPSDYTSLKGVSTIRYKDEQFWSSKAERESGAEFIEIDLGVVQAVNFLTFESIRKPYDIEISYDIYDQAPRRHFVTVTPDPIDPFESRSSSTHSNRTHGTTPSITSPTRSERSSSHASCGSSFTAEKALISSMTAEPGSDSMEH